ncbi:hypothetical protein PAE9249_02548 [Paenibacillus sp. CECT 9249]|uniref:hypothetical protein n=1 Tax=Paenibacillus sp. CECT 9249 TaxID=2845385 RepID=UPI001E62466A|nr:hypothetical protein [Paenibacillus sp. CECT 9249]CAH0120035.1 hypothetical protein PAE9249_02548 [Paenibacillus sp. CECT 9249]
MEKFGLFIGWMIGLFGLVILVAWLTAIFIERDSMSYDEQFVWLRKVDSDQ